MSSIEIEFSRYQISKNFRDYIYKKYPETAGKIIGRYEELLLHLYQEDPHFDQKSFHQINEGHVNRFFGELTKLLQTEEATSVYTQLSKIISETISSETGSVGRSNRGLYYKNFEVKINPKVISFLQYGSIEEVLMMHMRYNSIDSKEWTIPYRTGVVLQFYNIINEAFATPITSRFYKSASSKYFSLFPETDKIFGSEGSFFDADFTKYPGGWFLNPPDDPSFQTKIVSKLAQYPNITGAFFVKSDETAPLTQWILTKNPREIDLTSGQYQMEIKGKLTRIMDFSMKIYLIGDYSNSMIGELKSTLKRF